MNPYIIFFAIIDIQFKIIFTLIKNLSKIIDHLFLDDNLIIQLYKLDIINFNWMSHLLQLHHRIIHDFAPKNLHDLLKYLSSAGILTHEYYTIIAKHSNTENLVSALIYLSSAEILTQENFTIVARHPNTENLVSALIYLSSAEILTQENFTIVAQHPNSYTLARSFYYLFFAQMFTPENRAIVAQYPKPDELLDSLQYLSSTNILNQNNFDFIISYPHLREICTALKMFENNQINFTLKDAHIILDTIEVYLLSKTLVPHSIQKMLIPKEYHLERQQYLNRLIAFFLEKNLKLLSIDLIAHILEYVDDIPIYRLEAHEIIKHVQLPKELHLNHYKNDLKNKVQEYTKFQGQLTQLKLNKQDLLFRLAKFNFWHNRHSCAEAQEAFDKQHGLIINP